MIRPTARRHAHPGADPRCEHCRGVAIEVVREGEQARAQLCSCVQRCPTCQGSGWVHTRNDRLSPKAPCDCQRSLFRMRRFNEAHIPARHHLSTRASFVPTVGGSEATVMAGFTAVSSWLSDYQVGEENRGFVLHGPVGTGKTHLMIAALRELSLNRGVRVRFVEFTHLLADLKSAFDRGGGASAVIDPLVNVDVLAIDELGKGRNTEWEGTVLDELISRRYNAAATIIATTNYEPKATGQAATNLAVPGQITAGLVDRIGHRVFSRLTEMGDFIEVKSADYRRRPQRK